MPADFTPEEEARRLERLYSANPDGLVFARLADAYRRCGRLEEALELLGEGLVDHPDYATGHLIHGRVLREDGRPEEAAEAYRRVLELDAENLVALRSLAELAAERGEMEEARRWAKRVSRAEPFATFAPEEAVEAGGQSPAGGAERERDATGDAGAAPGRDDGPIPGEDRLASEIAAVADDQWWKGSDGSEDDGEDAEPEVATETMARLYAEQGLFEEAAEVYGRLAERRPDEPELRRRAEEMRRRAQGEEPPSGEEPSPGQERSAEGGPPAGEEDREESTAVDAGDAGRPAVSAREHFRALLRGRARADRPGEGAGDGEHAAATPEAVGGRSR